MIKKTFNLIFGRLARLTSTQSRPETAIAKQPESKPPSSSEPLRDTARSKVAPSANRSRETVPRKTASAAPRRRSTGPRSPRSAATAAPEFEPQTAQEPAAAPRPAAPPNRKSEFAELNIPDSILSGIDDLGFTRCTPVQAASLPPCLSGLDLTGRAQTGTGKTAAFLITIFNRFLAAGRRTASHPMALVLAPTRELALQIGRDAADLGKYTGIRHLVVYGGMDYQHQARELTAGVDLVIATPGRLIDYIQRRIVDLAEVEILVIDEADRMLDMGFIPDVRRILSQIPPPERRQTLLFSATLTEDIRRLASRWMRNPVTIEIEPEHVVPQDVEQIVYAVPARDKLALLLWLLNNEASERVLVFRNRRDRADELTRHLLEYGVKCALLSGDVPQQKRLHVLEAFREGRLRVIVATDVAGRGIHVDNISHVVNYDLPYEPEDYVHRIGRTGRAGVKGRAVSFACEEGSFALPEIEALINQPLGATQPSADMLKRPHPVHHLAAPQPVEDTDPALGRHQGPLPRRSFHSSARSGGRSHRPSRPPFAGR